MSTKTMYVVSKHDKHSRSYLSNIGKTVADFVVQHEGYVHELASIGSCDLTGPDGVDFAVKTYLPKKAKARRSVVFIDEVDAGSVRLHVPESLVKYDAPSTTLPPWASAAFSCDTIQSDSIAQLYFAQLPLNIAARLIGVPVETLLPFLRDGWRFPESPVLQASATKIAFNTEETVVDVRGLLAWLLLIRHNEATDAESITPAVTDIATA